MPALGGRTEEHAQVDALCSACDKNYATGGFWIWYDMCEKWFHGQCMNITSPEAKRIERYEYPSCSSYKRARVGSS